MKSELHESFSRDHPVETASNKRFGILVGGILLLFGAIRAWLHGEVGWGAIIVGGLGLVLVLAALIRPDTLGGAHNAWMKLGLVLHKITNPLFLGALYGIVIIPTGLVMRVFGVAPMGMGREPKGTYWIGRSKTSS